METIKKEEIPCKGEFIVDFYGGRPYLSGTEIVKIWLEDQSGKIDHPKYRELKKAIGNEKKLEEILAVFNIDENGYPVIGVWMLLQCLKKSISLANTWGKYQVTKDRFFNSIKITPELCNLYNGKLITEPDGVEVYAISIPGKPSFFKAYQFIKASATFEMTITYPEDLCEKVLSGKGNNKIFGPDPDKSKQCVMAVLDKMQTAGLGAYRLRFGKFKWINL